MKPAMKTLVRRNKRLLVVVLGVSLLAFGGCQESTTERPTEGTAPGAVDANGAAPTSSELPPPRCNIVVILIDTLRPDHLQHNGYDRPTSPFMADFAASAAVFRNAFSTSSWTAPSTASVFTGLYPTRHGITRGFHANRKQMESVEATGEAPMDLLKLPESIMTLPERIQAAGYRTLAITTNVNIDDKLGFHRGFDSFQYHRQGSVEDVEQTMAQWHAGGRFEAPYFLYLHLNEVHMPYVPHQPFYQPHDDPVLDGMSRYDSEIHHLDRKLKAWFQRMQWDESTLVWFLSDHGEEFMDHGQIGHKYSLYRELNDVLDDGAEDPEWLPARSRRMSASSMLCPLFAIGYRSPAMAFATALRCCRY